MSINNEALLIILLLLPGFFGVGVYSFIKAVQPSTANSIVFAIFLCVISNFIAERLGLIELNADDLKSPTIFSNQIFSYVLVLGLISSLLSIALLWISQSNWLNGILYRSGLQKHFSQEFVWDRVFKENNRKWVMIELKDGSRIVGYAKWYSQKDQERTLCLGDAELQVVQTVGKVTKRKVTTFGGDYLIMNFDDVRAIEFRS